MAKNFESGERVDSPASGVPFTDVSTFTIAYWINLDADQAAENRPFRFGDGANSLTNGFQTAGRTLQWVDEGLAWRGSGVLLTAGVWAYILWYRSAGGNVFLEKDGVAVENFGIAPNTVSGGVHFGGTEFPNDFDGSMAEVASWQAVLSAAERAALAAGATPMLVRPGDLKMYVPAYGPANDEGGQFVGGTWPATGTLPQVNHPPVGPPILP